MDTCSVNIISPVISRVIDTLHVLPIKSSFEFSVGVAKIVSAAGTVVVAVLAIWGERFKRKPRLELVSHNFRGDLTVLQPGNRPTIFYQLMVNNRRKSLTARNVRVICIAVKRRIIDGSYRDIFLPTNPQLVNTPGEMSPISPNIRDNQIVDLGLIIQNDNIFIPRFYVTPNNFPGTVAANESVRLTFKIVADNFYSDIQYEYEISYDGIWTDNLENMQNHLVIRRVNN